MVTNNCVQVEYIHRLTEDIGETLKAGTSVRRTSVPGKSKSYAAFNGMEFVGIPREKVQVYQVTTRTITEEVLVEDEQSQESYYQTPSPGYWRRQYQGTLQTY